MLDKIGFKRLGRCFSHDDCPFIIDFVNPPIAIGNESIRHFETIKTSNGTLKLLTPTECVNNKAAVYPFLKDVP